MKFLKKILFYLILIFTFAFTFSQDENKITIFQQKNEPAKLKIGVTKLKTKELEMNFSAEKRVIYAELPESVADNQIIFVSETLNEMPSVSTTNGRKSINNIKKYLTKDVKIAPKFQYKVVVGDKENGIEEGKRYIVINCKAPLSSVYIYVVEKETYYVKEIYKGKFNVPNTLEERNSEGIIEFTKNHALKENDVIGFDGNSITVNREVIKNTDVVKLKGDFPRRYVDSTWYVTPGIRITLSNGKSKEVDLSTGKQSWKFNEEFELEDGKNEKIRIISNDDTYLQIQLLNWRSDSTTDLGITIKYYYKSLREHTLNEDKINLKINPNEIDKQQLIQIGREHEFNSTSKILRYDGKNIRVENNIVNYVNVTSGYPSKVALNNQKIKLQILQNGAIVDNLETNEQGEFQSKEISLKRANKENIQIGAIQIIADSEEYLKFKIRMDKRFRDNTDNKFELRYSYNNKKIRTDEIQLNIEPNKEEELEETVGGIFVYNSTGLNAAILSADESGNLTADKGAGAGFDKSKVSQIGSLPKKVVFDNSKNDWGELQRVIITNESYTGSENDANTSQTVDFFGSNKFFNGDNRFSLYDGNEDAALILSTEKDHSDIITIDYAALGIRATESNDHLEFSVFHYNDDKNKLLNSTFKLEYQAQIDGEWITKKTDKLKIIIQPRADQEKTPSIEVDSPPVWYDYSQSQALSNVNHYRKVELLGTNAITREKNGGIFIKNDGWIKPSNIPEYQHNFKHKIEINAGRNGEVVKTTDEEGKTISSTFVNLGNGNEVMIAYDGGDDKSLSFGLSKYNYAGGKGKVFITHYKENSIEIDTVQEYEIIINKFNPLPYIDNTLDIKTTEKYIKSYEFNNSIESKPVTIKYGEVGIGDLDTRITEKFGGKGIEIRVTHDVLLVGEGEYSNYIIPAKLYLDREPRVKLESTDGNSYSILKGKNEEAVKGTLFLYIPSQEYLIPKTTFKIVEASDKTKSPLRIGVVVNNDKEKYFEEVTDLYLNLTEQRFVKTELIFENLQIQKELMDETTGKMKFIKLDKDNSNGTIVDYNGQEVHWGRVEGEVIDIPIPAADKDLKIELYDKNYNLIDENVYINKEKEIKLASNKFEILLTKEEKYIQFRLVNDNPNSYVQGEDSFYLRFSLIEKGKEKIQYLFTQRYDVKFMSEQGISKTIVIGLKNPAMYYENMESSTGVLGYEAGKIFIDDTKPGGESHKIGNHNTNQDRQKWWSVQGEISYPNYKEYEYEISDSRDFPWDSSLTKSIVVNGIEAGFIHNKTTDNYTLFIAIDYSFRYDIDTKKDTNFYIRWRKKGSSLWERIESIKVTIDDFEPTYYGKVYPAQELDDIGDNNYKVENKVGSGYEKLRTDEEDNYYIDLDTIYRDYQRYAGVLKLIDNKKLDNFKVKPLNNIVAKTPDGSEINGEVVFKEENSIEDNYLYEITLEPTKNIDETLKIPKKYKIYFKVTTEEYKKLSPKTTYQLYSNKENRNVLKIGFLNKDYPYVQELKLEQPLNFTTSGKAFEIYAEDLDFGTINMLFNRGEPIKKYAETKVYFYGEDIENLDVSLEGNMIEGDGYKTTISEYNTDVEIPNGDKLEVNKIKLNKILENEEEGIKMKVYNLGGSLTVPLNSNLGIYRGEIYLNTTIISK